MQRVESQEEIFLFSQCLSEAQYVLTLGGVVEARHLNYQQ